MVRHPMITQIEDYEKFVGTETVERIQKKAKSLQTLHVANVNSTYYGGGVGRAFDIAHPTDEQCGRQNRMESHSRALRIFSASPKRCTMLCWDD